MKDISDEELIQIMQHGNQQKLDRIFSYLYRKVYDQVFYFILKYKGGEADVEDVFHDGLIALLKRVRRGELANNFNVEAYLFTICKNNWFKQLGKRKITLSPDEIQMAGPMEELPLDKMIRKEEKEEIIDLLKQLGEGCRKVLLYYYYDRFRMKKIANLMGYSSEQVAKNRKLECMKKLKKLYFND